MISEQPEIHGPLNRFRARRHTQLLVYRPEVGFHGIARNVKSACYLQIGSGWQQLQDPQLGRDYKSAFELD